MSSRAKVAKVHLAAHMALESSKLLAEQREGHAWQSPLPGLSEDFFGLLSLALADRQIGL